MTEIFEKQQRIDDIVKKYHDRIGGEAAQLTNALALQLVEKSLQTLESMDVQDRLLQIGIVGRVKAGKSSLINALLFDGRSILPKAATPMTAALTVIEYGDKFGAEIDYYSQKDVDNIKALHAEYKSEEQRLYESYYTEALNAKKERATRKRGLVGIAKEATVEIDEATKAKLQENTRKKVARTLKENTVLDAGYDQYERISRSGLNVAQLQNQQPYRAENLEQLKAKLEDFVGAEGKYMPFTKSVRISIPDQRLKDIQIVDTPGVNDPVRSREERTRQLLQECDVIFIVSPSGQMLNSVDLDLMDRITSKEGVRELHLVASQIDTQLMGHIKAECKGDLQEGLSLVSSELSEHMHASISQLKSEHQEIGSTFDQLIEGEVVFSSGICQSLLELWNNRESWDSGMEHVWTNLKMNYPDYFSDTDKKLSLSNLQMLANIDAVRSIVDSVRAKKDDILAKRKDEFLQTKTKSILDYHEKLIRYIEEQEQEIKNGDIGEFELKRKELSKIKEAASVYLEEEYHLLIENLEISCLTLRDNLGNFFKTARKSAEGQRESETSSRTVSDSKWYNIFSWGRSHTEYSSYSTLRSGAVRNILENLTLDIEASIKVDALRMLNEWRKCAPKKLIKTIRSKIDDQYLEKHKIIKSLSQILNSITYPQITYSGTIPESLAARGTLPGSEVERFLDDVREYMSELQGRMNRDIEEYASSLVGKLKKVELSQEFFSSYDEMLKTLKGQVENKDLALDSFARAKNELNLIAELV